MGFIEDMEEHKTLLARNGLSLPASVQKLLDAAYKIRAEQQANNEALFAECVTAKDVGTFLVASLKNRGITGHSFTEKARSPFAHGTPITRAGTALLNAVETICSSGMSEHVINQPAGE
jgi:hypothetical protein